MAPTPELPCSVCDAVPRLTPAGRLVTDHDAGKHAHLGPDVEAIRRAAAEPVRELDPLDDAL